jgi:hypothetical protein
MNIENNNRRTKQIFYDSTYLFINLLNYINISNIIKLFRCNKRLYEQIYITYKYITYSFVDVLNWKEEKNDILQDYKIVIINL